MVRGQSYQVEGRRDLRLPVFAGMRRTLLLRLALTGAGLILLTLYGLKNLLGGLVVELRSLLRLLLRLRRLILPVLFILFILPVFLVLVLVLIILIVLLLLELGYPEIASGIVVGRIQTQGIFISIHRLTVVLRVEGYVTEIIVSL